MEKIIKTPSCDFKIQQWLGEYTPPPDSEEIENRASDREAAEYYARQQAELQMLEHENNFGNKQYL